jgi:hypothetical protein
MSIHDASSVFVKSVQKNEIYPQFHYNLDNLRIFLVWKNWYTTNHVKRIFCLLIYKLPVSEDVIVKLITFLEQCYF